jgi:uncharacterized protein with HXXEE motif
MSDTDTDLTAQATTRPAPYRTEWISAAVVAVLVVGFSVWAWLTLPYPAAFVLSLASVAAFVAWMATTYTHPVRSRRVIATFMCAVGFQFLHLAEEYVGGFPHELVELFHTSRQWSERSFLLTFAFGFGALWCVAAAGALYQIRIANYMMWFYALGAGLINALSHFVYPIIKGGYFPGLYTAAGHLVLGILLVSFLIQEGRSLKTGNARPADDVRGGHNEG